MTSEQISEQLRRRLPDFEATGAPERLAGGLLNHVWRVPGRPASVIVKHAPPHIATAPDVPLDPSRLLFEAWALAALGEGGMLEMVATPEARPPRLYDVDEDAFVLVMEDVGTVPDLGTWLRQERPVGDLGSVLGAFIGRLHRASFGDEALAQSFHNLPVQATRHAVQYCAVEGLLQNAGMEEAAALGARAVALGEQLQQAGRCLIQGDLWPPSVLVTPEGLRLIDWEFAHFGHPAQDLAHFAAHCWMHAHRAPNAAVEVVARGLLGDFLRSYAKALGDQTADLLTPDVLDACAVHFGAEILVRTVGAFQEGYLYAGHSPEASAVQEAVAVAAEHLRVPGQVETFGALR